MQHSSSFILHHYAGHDEATCTQPTRSFATPATTPLRHPLPYMTGLNNLQHQFAHQKDFESKKICRDVIEGVMAKSLVEKYGVQRCYTKTCREMIQLLSPIQPKRFVVTKTDNLALFSFFFHFPLCM